MRRGYGGFFPQHKAALQALMEYETAVCEGRAVGLSEADAKATIKAWTDYFRQTPYAIDWRRIRRAVVSRGVGLAWEPPQP